MKGIGKTVFSGDKVEEFPIEILGVMENSGPKQSIILARLSGPTMERTGVMQGMSGSPVYIDGKLVGAIALTFAYSKEPIAGIRPIEEMLNARPRPIRAQNLQQLAQVKPDTGNKLVEIATPFSLSGFTPGTLKQFEPQLRSLGLEPAQGTLGGGGGAYSKMGDSAKIRPGSMISVQLVTGDWSMGADGTVTHVDGKRVYAFGHRFMSVGSTDLPFARSEVLTLLPNLNTSFKIAAAREPMGAITGDHNTVVSGELGRQASMVPVTIDVKGRNRYSMKVAKDRLLTPFLLQMATFSAVDSTERTAGAATVSVTGRIEFESSPPVSIANIYSAETGVPIIASLAAAIHLSYAMQSGFPEFNVKSVTLQIDAAEERRQLQIEQLWASRNVVRPGESLDLHLLLAGPGGVEVKRQATYHVPTGSALGQLQINVADAMTANLADFAYILQQPPSTAMQVRTLLNGLRSNNVATLRIARVEPSYTIQGQNLPDPPPSLALLLRRTPGVALPGANSKLVEFSFPIEGYVVGGNKSITVDIKE
jgi:hypothetical protein